MYYKETMISSSLGLHIMIYNFGRRLWCYQDQAESIDAAHLSLTLFKACPIFPNSTFSSVLHIPARNLNRKFLLQGILYKSCARNPEDNQALRTQGYTEIWNHRRNVGTKTSRRLEWSQTKVEAHHWIWRLARHKNP